MVAVMYKPCGLRVEYVCDGPDAEGGCPMVPKGQVVPCAGRKVVLSKDERSPGVQMGLERVTYWVAANESRCPIVAMEPDFPRKAMDLAP